MMCQVGQTFLHFQWDILLLEAGALGVLVSPLWPGQQRTSLAQDRVTMFLVRSVSLGIISLVHLTISCLQVALVPDDVCQWRGQGEKKQETLIFNLTIQLSCQLTSGCDAWWGLSAMPTHYFSQCLPTPLSWY